MKDLAHLRAALKETFRTADGWIAATVAFVLVVLTAMILPSYRLIGFILNDTEFAASFKLDQILKIAWNGTLVFTYPGGWIVGLLAVFFALDAALLFHYMRRQVRLNRAAGASMAGILVGLLGVGCASCGSVLLVSLLGAGATAGILGFLPFHGREFAWLGLAIMAYAIFSISKKIADPAACKIPRKR